MKTCMLDEYKQKRRQKSKLIKLNMTLGERGTIVRFVVLTIR